MTISGTCAGDPHATHAIDTKKRKRVKCCSRPGPRSETETEPESSDEASTEARGLSTALMMISVGTCWVRSLIRLVAPSSRMKANPSGTRQGLTG